jgi:hypothetical protein
MINPSRLVAVRPATGFDEPAGRESLAYRGPLDQPRPGG